MSEFLSEKLRDVVGLSSANADLAASAILAVLATVILVTFVAASAVFFIWLERKVAGRIQDRLGPTRVGGRFGWLQTIADGMKLLVKEDIIPANADHMLFRLGPYIAFCGAFLAFLALPFGKNIVARNLNVAVFFMLAVMSTEVSASSSPATARARNGRYSAACAKPHRWSATKCPWRSACSSPSRSSAA